MARRARHLWWVLGVALVVGGLVLVLTASPQPADMGWFAYTPLNDGSDWEMQWGEGSAVFVTRTELLGWTGTASGLVVLASWAGYRLGRRRASATG